MTADDAEADSPHGWTDIPMFTVTPAQRRLVPVDGWPDYHLLATTPSL